MNKHYLEFIGKELDRYEELKKNITLAIKEIDNEQDRETKKFEELSKTLSLDNSISLNVLLEKNNDRSFYRNMLVTLLNEEYESLEKYYFEVLRYTENKEENI